MPSIYNSLTKETGIPMFNSLRNLHYSIKSLCYRAKRGSKIRFQEMSQNLFEVIYKIFDINLESLLQGIMNNVVDDSMRFHGETAVIAMKILKGLILYGFEDWHLYDYIVNFMNHLLIKYHSLLQIEQNANNVNELLSYVEKINKTITKLIIESLKCDPKSFLVVAESYLSFCFEQFEMMNMTSNVCVLAMDVIQTIMKGLNKIGEYKGTEGGRHLSENVFTDERIKSIVHSILTKYFIITEDELELWSMDPETYIEEEEIDNTYLKRRPWAEKLFVTIIKGWPDITLPILSSLLDESFRNNDFNSILLRDSCYRALSISMIQLVNHFDINDHLNILYESSKNQDPSYRIINRRSSELISSWVTEIRPENFEVVYNIYSNHLSSEDLVVSLTAVKNLGYIINDLSFKVEVFEPFIEKYFESIFSIFNRIKHMDFLLSLFNLIGYIIDEIEYRVKPYTNRIMELLLGLWNTNINDIIRMSILRTLSKLVLQMDGLLEYSEYIFPLIHNSTNISSDVDNPLLEDGILLWLSTLRSSPIFHDMFMELFVNFFKIMERGFSPIIQLLCLKLLTSYIILGHNVFMQRYIGEINHIFTELIGTTNDEITREVLKPIETMIILNPTDIPPNIEPLLTKIISKIFDDKETNRARCYYLNVYLRLIVHNPVYTKSLLSKLSKQYFENDDLVIQFIELINNDIDYIADFDRKKIAAMALCVSLDWVPIDIIKLSIYTISGVIMEEESNDNNDKNDYQDDAYIGNDVYFPELKKMSLQGRQLQALYENDPVNYKRVRDLLIEKMESIHQIDNQLFNEIISSIDDNTRKILKF